MVKHIGDPDVSSLTMAVPLVPLLRSMGPKAPKALESQSFWLTWRFSQTNADSTCKLL